MKKLALCLAAMVMTGCVTKTPATENDYNKFAAGYVKLRQCNSTGEIPTATAAYGLTLIQGALSNYTYDNNYLEQRVNYFSQPENLKTIPLSCADIAMQITQRQQQIATENENSRQLNQAIQNFANNTPKTTYCNRYGTMVTCNTY